MYGLKQAPRAWNKRIDGFLEKSGITKCLSEHGVYVKFCDNGSCVERIFICLYVDGLLIGGSSEELVAGCKHELLKEFEMSDLGNLSYFLGIELKQTSDRMVMHQTKYITDMLKKFSMQQSNPTNIPVEVVMKLEKNSEE